MIGYYLHHVGQGHRRRGTAVARSLRTEVVGLGSGGPPPGWPGTRYMAKADREGRRPNWFLFRRTDGS